ncbi:hypothetical protein EDC96DRAFT_445263, partial [Choanephora cucurbitarum]
MNINGNLSNLSSELVPTDYDFNQRRPSAKLIEIEHTVLASNEYSPVKLHYYHGSEEENFSDLSEALHDFFGTRKIKDDYQKLSYLRSLMKGIARIEFNKKYPDLTNLKYEEVIQQLESKFSSTKSQIKKVEAFEETFQCSDESPANFFVRVSEMAVRAGISDEQALYRRFRYGLLPEYFKHCQALGAETHTEYYKYSQG